MSDATEAREAREAVDASERVSTDVDATSAFLGRSGPRQRNADGWHPKRPTHDKCANAQIRETGSFPPEAEAKEHD